MGPWFCSKPLRRLTLAVFAVAAPSVVYLLWHLQLFSVVPPVDKAGPSGSRQHYMRQSWNQEHFTERTSTLGAENTASAVDINKNASDDDHYELHLRSVADLESKCERRVEVAEGSVRLCPCVPPSLVGPQSKLPTNLTENDVIKNNPDVTSGGRWHPQMCIARQRLCVLVPYRNRSSQVMPFIAYIHARLRRQQRDYAIYLIEQSKGSRFNRGLLLNAGFQHVVNSLRERRCDCVILHDIDMTANDDRNVYLCPPGGALQMAVYRQHLNYSLPYVGYFGGITAVRADDFHKANGYSNMYFGWGSEDDEFLQRLFAVGVKLVRHLPEVSRVTMMVHDKIEPNRERLMLYVHWKERWDHDGVSSVAAVANVTRIEEKPLYTSLLVEVNEERVKEITLQLIYRGRT